MRQQEKIYTEGISKILYCVLLNLNLLGGKIDPE